MEKDQALKKTGSTPLPDQESAEALGPGEVLGITEVKTIICKLREGSGSRPLVKFAFVIPGGEVYFLDDQAARMKPAQQWVKKQILRKLGLEG